MMLADKNARALKGEYNLADYWRTGWTRLSCKHESGRLQAKQDRIDHRARRSSARVLRVMKVFDDVQAAGVEINSLVARALLLPASALVLVFVLASGMGFGLFDQMPTIFSSIV
ncbi:hypothetical protein [Polaromonas sp.]|uniref:hypothetical protein n=1 Tax=Polaromonas sp. TaxID=1869339 RepID=UPI00352AB429